VLWEYLLRFVQLGSDFRVKTEELDGTVRAMALDGEAKPFVDYVVRNIFNKLSNRDLQKFDEKYIKIMLLACLFQSNAYVPVSEMETSNGYIDIYLHRSPLLPEVKYEWLFELKYIKAGKANAKSLPALRSEAQKQMQDYSSSYRMRDSKDVKKAVILFIGKNKYEMFV
jgi:hypothetical protein